MLFAVNWNVNVIIMIRRRRGHHSTTTWLARSGGIRSKKRGKKNEKKVPPFCLRASGGSDWGWGWGRAEAANVSIPFLMASHASNACRWGRWGGGGVSGSGGESLKTISDWFFKYFTRVFAQVKVECPLPSDSDCDSEFRSLKFFQRCRCWEAKNKNMAHKPGDSVTNKK